MTTDRRCPLCVLAWIAAGSAWLAPATGYGYTWDYSPIVATGVSYETNPDYVSDSSLEDDAYSAVLDGTLVISAETSRGRIGFRPRARTAVYAGSVNGSDLNGTDFYLPLEGFWTSQRVQYSVNTGYSRISTRNSEVFVTDPNDSGQTGSSGRVVTVDEDQKRAYFDPEIDIQIDPRDLLGLTLSVEDVRYTQAELTGRSDYTYGASGASWTHSLGLKSRISGSLNLNGFKATQPGSTVENKTVSYGFDVGYQYSLSGITSLGLTVGASQSDISVTGLQTIDADNNPNTPPLPCFDPQQNSLVLCELKSTDNNFVGRVYLRQQTAETITTEVSVSRSLEPDSDGAQVTQDAANAYVTKAFTPSLTGSLGVTYNRQNAVGKDVAGSLAQRFDREYSRADASLSWSISQTWSLTSRYTFSHDQQKSGATYTTDNNTLSLQLQYAGLGKH